MQVKVHTARVLHLHRLRGALKLGLPFCVSRAKGKGWAFVSLYLLVIPESYLPEQAMGSSLRRLLREGAFLRLKKGAMDCFPVGPEPSFSMLCPLNARLSFPLACSL